MPVQIPCVHRNLPILGQLEYLQNCKSVVIALKMDWIQHHHPLMKSSGPQQNYVEVSWDFHDLNNTIQWLMSHDDEAQRIADNSVKTFRERYLMPAAKVCYWRRLIQSWASVSLSFSRRSTGRRFGEVCLLKHFC